jgi:4-amino-4-deoxy-L-arabinose transferase-like glycosyltransferase
MGADQSLYAYVGERILRGELPYVHAWDQKPPAIHYTYALLRAIWPADGVVAAADLAAAAGVAALLFAIGRQLASPAVGAAAALLFLLLSNPAFTRLAGVRIRAQCETFIALAVTAAAYLLVRHWRGRSGAYFASGVLLGLAFTFKYNAIVYAAAAAAIVVAGGALTKSRAVAFVAGLAVFPLIFLMVLAGALGPLYEATISYNLEYSGETYRGLGHFAGYLLTFPVQHARIDALWTLGGAGCAALLALSRRRMERLVPVVWVAAACLSMAINGSRGLPQYFVQVAPGMALAAAWGGWLLAGAVRRSLPGALASGALVAAVVVVSVAVWRVNQFPKLVEQTVFDLQHMTGRMPREAYLGRFVDGRKYTALGAVQVARLMQEHSRPGTPVFLFGFTPAAYVHADRPSASRFFWSRPVIAGFRSDAPGYGVAGLLADLDASRPAVVVLQINDWAPDVDDSAHYFLSTPPLAEWLRANYRSAAGPDGFDVWLRRE